MKKNKLKRISSKIFFGGVLFLSNISLISIGFSAWSIVGAASAEAQIQVSAADVVDLSKYFIFNQSEDTIDNNGALAHTVTFNYNDYGVVDNGLITKKGSFTFWMAVKLRGDGGLFDLNQALSAFVFDYSIRDSGDFALTDFLDSASYEISNGSTKVVSDESKTIVTKETKPYSISVRCDNNSLLSKDKLFYKTKLIFDFSSVKNFKTEIADKMAESCLSIGVRYEA